MNAAAFRDSLTRAAPPDDVAGPLAGLWWAAKGDWDKAHKIVQDDESAEAAWVHAYLHRVEGDLPNACYWYGTAAKPAATGEFDAEWAAIVTSLLQAPAR